MSIRKAFEKIGQPKAKEHETLRQARGTVNEYDVTLALYREPVIVGPIKEFTIQVILRIEGGLDIVSSDYQRFEKQEEADERFNLLVIQYGLREDQPKLESGGGRNVE